MVGVGEKVLLFRHQPASELLLQRLTDHDELQDGDLIEVIIAGQRSTASVEHLSVIYWLFIPLTLILIHSYLLVLFWRETHRKYFKTTEFYNSKAACCKSSGYVNICFLSVHLVTISHFSDPHSLSGYL